MNSSQLSLRRNEEAASKIRESVFSDLSNLLFSPTAVAILPAIDDMLICINYIPVVEKHVYNRDK